ncbi:MAG: RQC-minor-1 family DNA-binding protein [Eubacteriales bacterium]|nr:RQC-minor-1 family DNA-binding protein [Eubacteriales bacterium]
MNRQRNMTYTLNAGDIRRLPEGEIKVILRAADEVNGVGGRAMLTKILKGSADHRLLEYQLDKCPAYGYYKSMTLEEISHRVDWMIKKAYLRVTYNGRLPVLEFTDKGWEIERETYAEELFERCLRAAKAKDLQIVSELKTGNRQVVFDVLEKIRATKDPDFLPLLDEWKVQEVRKVRERIVSVEETIERQEEGPVIVWLRAEKKDARRIASLVERTIRNIYPRHYPISAIHYFLFLHSEYRILADIERNYVGMLFCDGKLVGTGSREKNHVMRVFVLPEEQGRGFGTRIMEELEWQIKKKNVSAELEASIPAEAFYEHRGYRTIREKRMDIGEMDLSYKVMKKVLEAKGEHK